MLAGLAALACLVGGAAAAPTSVVFNNIPDPTPGNVVSMGFEATSTSELGIQVQLAGTDRVDPTITVLMSSWGCENGAWNSGDCSTTPGTSFEVPMTIRVYTVGAGGAVGSPVITSTQTFFVPYRPSASPTCGDGRWYNGTSCFNGFAVPISFNLVGTMPDTAIVSVAYNTSHYGYEPVGDGTICYVTSGGCGYDSLNVGLVGAPTVGVDPQPDDAYINSSWTGAYCSGPAGTFRLDAGCWTGYRPAIKVEASSAGHSVSAVGPAKVWVGVHNSDDVGTTLNLKAEVLKGNTVVGTGQINNVPSGSSGFAKAINRTIAMALSSGSVTYNSGDVLGFRLSVQAGSSGHRSGTAELWYNSSAANSQFSVTVDGSPTTYYLLGGLALGTSPGGAAMTVDVGVDRLVNGNAFKPFGTWTTTIG